MKTRTSKLGLAFMAPALFLLALFYVVPAILTGVFAFTNMSTSTGITGGAYVIQPSTIRLLEQRKEVGAEVAKALGEVHFSVTDEGLAAAEAAKVSPALVAEMRAKFLGKSFEDSRSFEAAIKTLKSRPTRPRELKLAVEPFKTAIVNQRFSQRSAFEAAVKAQVPEISEDEIGAVAKASYTGWVWTTENFTKMAGQSETWRILGNTAFYVSSVLCFNVGVGLFLAIVTFYMPKRTAGFFSVLWLLPRITPVVLYAVLWKWLTWDGGFLPSLLGQFGLPNFNYMKGSVPTAWATVICVNGFVGASFGMILFSGALRAIPQQQLWASEVDGATRWQQVRRIILPQMRWPILFVTSYQTLSLLASYESIWLTTNGGPGRTTTVWSLEAFQQAFSNYSGNLAYGYGAAMALVLVTVGLILSVLYLRIFKFDALLSKPRIEY